MILYGPPGTGKTTLARMLATNASAAFEELSAVEAGRAAFLAGRMPKKLYSASPSSPSVGMITPSKYAIRRWRSAISYSGLADS